MRCRSPRHAWFVMGLAACLAATLASIAPAQGPAPRRNPGVPRQILESLYRPTVTILKGRSRGSGTIIASRPGESLVLTAAHVIAPEGELSIEIQPYNLGVETDPRHADVAWPQRLPAEVIARDDMADVAIVRVQSRATMPYVARLALQAEEPASGAILTSVGVDQNNPMTGWRTDVRGTAMIDIGKGGARPFTLTTKPPEHGRSGGGLFLPDGAIVGVCVGRLNIQKDDPTIGVFASIESIRALIRENDLEARLTAPEAFQRFTPRRSALPARPRR